MKNFIVLVLGRKGSGKTFYVKNKLLPLLNRYIVIDILNEYDGYCVTDFLQLMDAVDQGKQKIICKFEDDLDTAFAFEFIWELRNITLVLEEIDLHADSRSIDPILEKLIKYGRHHNLNLIGICRRPYELNTIFRSQADSLVTFQQHEIRDLEYLVKTFDANPQLIKYLDGHESITLRADPETLIKDLTNTPEKSRFLGRE